MVNVSDIIQSNGHAELRVQRDVAYATAGAVAKLPATPHLSAVCFAEMPRLPDDRLCMTAEYCSAFGFAPNDTTTLTTKR